MMNKVWLLLKDSGGGGWWPPSVCGVYATRELAIAERDRRDPGPFEDEDDEPDVFRQFGVREYDIQGG